MVKFEPLELDATCTLFTNTLQLLLSMVFVGELTLALISLYIVTLYVPIVLISILPIFVLVLVDAVQVTSPREYWYPLISTFKLELVLLIVPLEPIYVYSIVGAIGVAVGVGVAVAVGIGVPVGVGVGIGVLVGLGLGLGLGLGVGVGELVGDGLGVGVGHTPTKTKSHILAKFATLTGSGVAQGVWLLDTIIYHSYC